MTSKQTLKEWFSNLKKPTQSHFWAWLESYWHKEEKIPMQTIEGLDTALQNTASVEQVENHFSDSQAHKNLFDLKVDKEEGKGLSANDYSNQEKQKVQETADKMIVGMSITGDVNKIATLTFSDGTTLNASFKDFGGDTIADVMLNSLNFNIETGVLTGIRSDGEQINTILDGRYSLIKHTHWWDDIKDKPTNLATETFVSEEIGKLKIGGRNLILKSSVKKENQDYLIAEYPLSQNNQYINGEEYTITIWGNLNPAKTHFSVYNSGGYVELCQLSKISEGVYSGTFRWKNSIVWRESTYTADNSFLNVYQVQDTVNAVSSIEKIKLEKGNIATDWSPAPEDIFAEITTRQLPISQSVTTSALINGFSQNGRTMVSTGTNEIVVTIDSPDGFSASYQKGGLGNISFVVGSGKRLVQVDETNVINGLKGSTATISVIGNEILLRISNV